MSKLPGSYHQCLGASHKTISSQGILGGQVFLEKARNVPAGWKASMR